MEFETLAERYKRLLREVVQLAIELGFSYEEWSDDATGVYGEVTGNE